MCDTVTRTEVDLISVVTVACREYIGFKLVVLSYCYSFDRMFTSEHPVNVHGLRCVTLRLKVHRATVVQFDIFRFFGRGD